MSENITKDRVRVTHSALPGLEFRTSSGAGGKYEITKRRETAGGPQQSNSGRQSFNDMSTTIAYTRETLDLERRLLSGDKIPGGLTRQPLDLDDIPIPGSQRSFVGCTVASYDIPDTDVDSSEPGDITIVWSVGAAA